MENIVLTLNTKPICENEFVIQRRRTLQDTCFWIGVSVSCDLFEMLEEIQTQLASRELLAFEKPILVEDCVNKLNQFKENPSIGTSSNLFV